MELHCIRHGVTTKNISGRFNGWIDDSIIAEEAKFLQKRKFDTSSYDAIYCSPMKRCIETAQALAIDSWIEDARIKERNLGIFEGKTPRECELLFSDEFGKFKILDENYKMPKGESRKQNLDRVMSWIKELRDFNKVLAITHGGTIDFLYRMASGTALHGGETIFTGKNAAISMFSKEANNWCVIGFDEEIN